MERPHHGFAGGLALGILESRTAFAALDVGQARAFANAAEGVGVCGGRRRRASNSKARRGTKRTEK